MPFPSVRLVPWGPEDRPLLERLVGDPAMMVHLGGPESPERIAERQARYEAPGSRQHKIVAAGEDAGWVGYWEREWRGEVVWEIGWAVLPGLQGRGIAREGTRALIALARAEPERRAVHAYPGVENAASNALCRSLGFTLLGPHDFEYPKGHRLRCNDWRLES